MLSNIKKITNGAKNAVSGPFGFWNRAASRIVASIYTSTELTGSLNNGVKALSNHVAYKFD